jgi:dolichol-phosphate mannosyltransferase
MPSPRLRETIEDGAAAASRTLVIIPVYNEAQNICSLIDALLALPVAVDVIVVDDNSPDGTGVLVEQHSHFRERVFLLQRALRLGFARACRDGFIWGIDRGYTVCVEMDADFSHDPADVPRLLAEIENGSDVALGSRYLDGIRVINWPVRRLLLSLFAGSYIRLLSGLQLTDPTSGFKAIRADVLRNTEWRQFAADGYGFIVEFHFHVSRDGFHIKEVPIVFTERRRGGSKMSYKIMIESAVRVLKLGCYRSLHRRTRKAERPVESLRYA